MSSKLLLLKVIRENLCVLESLAISTDDKEVQEALYSAIDSIRPLIYRKEERLVEAGKLLAVVGG